MQKPMELKEDRLEPVIGGAKIRQTRTTSPDSTDHDKLREALEQSTRQIMQKIIEDERERAETYQRIQRELDQLPSL